MRMLSAQEAARISTVLQVDLPQRVLLAVAREGGRRAAQISDDALGQLPALATPEDGPAWVNEVLEWFIGRGDLERGPGGRFRCVPPHLVGASSGGPPRLYGDPLVEGRLERDLGGLGVSVSREVVYAPKIPADDRPGQPDGQTGLPIGLERCLSGDAGDDARLARICERSRVAVIHPDTLKAGLPHISAVVTPPESDLGPVHLRTGLWEAYDPAHEGNRWRANAYWKAGSARLVRWRPSDDLRGSYNVRVFYHAGEGRVAEMGQETARLWQLSLDSQAKKSRFVWLDGPKVWVPRIVPAETQRWLQIVCGRPGRRVWWWLVLEARRPVAEEVCAVLAETLGLRPVRGSPPHEGSRPYQRGRRQG